MDIKQSLNLHLVCGSLEHDSRILREAGEISRWKTFEAVEICELPGKPESRKDRLEGLALHRVDVLSRALPGIFPFQTIKYLEWHYRILQHYGRRSISVVHCHDVFPLPVAVHLKKMTRARLVYDAHELETEANGLHGLEKALVGITERLFISQADSIITSSPSFAEGYSILYRLEKPHVLLNCPAYRDCAPCSLLRDELDIRPDQSIFLYQGGLTPGRGIEIMLEAFSSMPDDKNILVCMGYGPLGTIIEEASRQRPDTIRLRKAVAPELLLEYTSSADYGILFLEDICRSYRHCLPNKLFEYVMAGLPVISSNLPGIRGVVERHGLGVVADGFSAGDIADAVRQIQGIGRSAFQSGIEAAKKLYCWERQRDVLMDAYRPWLLGTMKQTCIKYS